MNTNEHEYFWEYLQLQDKSKVEASMAGSETWKVEPQLLMQELLELGLG